MMRKLLLSLSLGIFAAASHAEKPSDYATGIKLNLPGKEAFYRVELPPAVHAQARSDLADVRVFNANGETMPYALGAWRNADHAPQPSTFYKTPWFPLKEVGPGGLAGLDIKIEQNSAGKIIALKTAMENSTATSTKIIAYIFDASSLDKDSQALLLDWPSTATGYNLQATLEASDDLKSWHELISAPLLEMNFAGQKLTQKRIAFARGHYKYLRLSADQALPALSSAQLESAANIEAAAMAQRWLHITATAGEKDGEYVFDSGANLSVTGLVVQLPQNNTVAPLELLVRERRDAPWRSLMHTTSYRLTRDGREISSPRLDIRTKNARFWMLRLDPRAGNTGPGMPRLTLGWTPRQLVFVARGDAPFTLAFGRRDAKSAQLPLASLLPGYVAGAETALPSATLGTARALGGKSASTELVTMHWKQWILWSVLLLGVAFLAWMAKGLMAQVKPEP